MTADRKPSPSPRTEDDPRVTTPLFMETVLTVQAWGQMGTETIPKVVEPATGALWAVLWFHLVHFFHAHVMIPLECWIFSHARMAARIFVAALSAAVLFYGGFGWWV